MIEEIQPSLRLNEMPQLAFGTALPVKVTWGGAILKKRITEALMAGYRHIDTAVRYSTQDFMEGANNSEEYYTAFKEGIKDSGVDRKDIWITLKGTGSNWKEELKQFGLTYVDLYITKNLVHLEQPLNDGNIRYWGLEHVKEFSEVPKVGNHTLFAIQIQARGDEDSNLIVALNNQNIRVQLFSPISGLETSLARSAQSTEEIKIAIIKYYLKKYILNKKNVLIVGSFLGGSINLNFKLFSEIVTEKKDYERPIESFRNLLGKGYKMERR